MINPAKEETQNKVKTYLGRLEGVTSEGDLNHVLWQRKSVTGREQPLEIQRKERTLGVLGI